MIAIPQTTKATGDLIGNKIADAGIKFYNDKVTNTSLQNAPEANSINGLNTTAQTAFVIPRER